ncbi:MAG: hypothetical protein OEX00_09655, partial [Gammaproteobacteria bacterium]|nr:hypothetical protein [Gammaproteobacteria bacterium]
MNIRKLPVQVTIPLVCLSLLGCEMQGDISDEIATDTMYADLHVTLTQGKSVAVVEVQLLYQEPENKQYIILGDQDRFVATIDKLYSEANYANNLFDNLNYSLETNRVLTEHLSNSWTTVASSFSALSPIYSTSFDNASTDTVYRISFERDTGADAPASYILMPSPVSITSPLSGGTHDPRAELLVQWNEAIENETV